jgi:hypothetical protein
MPEKAIIDSSTGHDCRGRKTVHNRAENTLQTGQVGCCDPSGRRMDCAGSDQDAEFGSGVVWHPESRFRVQG